jgi:hypothetical protein
MTFLEIFFIVIICGAFALIYKWVYELDLHFEWFNSLKPGDMIKVDLYSNDCECTVEAMVVAEPKGKYIEAEISTDNKEKCSHCHKANNTCLYDVNLFHRSIVNKLPE